MVVEPIETGDALWPASFFARAGRGPLARLRALGVGSKPETWESRPVPAYLARHPSAGNILVDTGLHPSVARDPRDNLGRFSGRHYRVEEGKDVVSQLRDARSDPADIAVVVLTHLHEDHASAIEVVPGSAVRRQRDRVGGGDRAAGVPLLRGYTRSHYDFAFDYAHGRLRRRA